MWEKTGSGFDRIAYTYYEYRNQLVTEGDFVLQILNAVSAFHDH